jgi:hypothetical protein
MSRIHLFEFHDMPWFPGEWRDVVTDVLRVFSIHTNPYRPVYPILLDAIRQARSEGIIDLCSGGSGPWWDLKGRLEQSGLNLPVLLTDKYPHRRAIQQALNQDGIQYLEESVDATHVAAHLSGFRTLFASFHHFRPTEAQRILQDAVEAGAGIAIMEYTGWTWGWFFASLFSPLFFWIASPFILRPFTLQHLVWIYLLPVPLLCTVWDSLVSGLRTYSPKELEEMVHFPRAETYEWTIGQCKSTRAPSVIYLVGIPRTGS